VSSPPAGGHGEHVLTDATPNVVARSRWCATFRPAGRSFALPKSPMNEMVEHDNVHALGWSPWPELKSLLRTLNFVLARRGL
jgi:hypothetical protein